MLEREHFVYQRVELPYGLKTRGQDRSPTAQRIFPEDMSGASVLDIGCCYGSLLYEAKRRGATRLVGLEIDPERLRQAKLLRDALGADVELSDEDFFDVCRRESFDYVLMLNLIHHLPDAVGALRVAARAARRALLLEFVTPADPRFGRGRLPGLGRLLSRQPVIVVSNVAGQTLLFSQSAMTRVLTEHEALVDRIDYLTSPKRERGRMIAIAHAKQT